MKLTTRQIQQIIKEELNKVLYENRKGLPKGIAVTSLPAKIIDALKAQKLEPLDLARINHLFKFFLRGDQYEARYAKKWIQSLYKDFPKFKKIVDNDPALSWALNPSSEFVPTQKDFSDTSNTPTGITTPDLYNYKMQYRFKVKNLAGRDLRNHNFTGANLSGADLRGANLEKANLRGAILRGAKLRGVDPYFVKPNNTNLYRANLNGADLRGADLREASMVFTDLSKADLRGANLSGANLTKADLRGADLRKANLSKVRLWDADLSGADLRGVDLSRASLYGAFYSRYTKFPKGFDPIKEDMIKK